MNQEIKSSSSMSLKERLQRMVWYRLLFLVGTVSDNRSVEPEESGGKPKTF